MVVVKCCSGCGVVKPLDDYYRDRSRPDGRTPRCKECAKEATRRYREENRDKVLERRRRYYEGNRGKAREYDRQYYEKNRDKVMDRTLRYREENREYVNRRALRTVNRYQSVTETSSTKSGPWSEVEIAILMADDGRTVVAKALELGRTYKSCNQKRKRLRRVGAAN